MSNQMNDNNQLIYSENEEKQCVEQLKHWLETEAKFYGRADEDFLLMFVRGCKMDMEKAKKKLYMYYENREKLPQWWTNRNIDELKSLIQLKFVAVLPDKNPELPTISITSLSKAPRSVHYDTMVKLLTIYLDMTIRRTNCQKNGVVALIDWADCPFWVFQKAMSPINSYNFIHLFYSAMPLRLKQVHLFNFPLVGRAAWLLFKSFLPPKIKNRFFLYGSDLSALQNNIDVRLLPEEYGGQNGSLVDHEETFLTETLSYSEYILDDNKYGFQ